MINRKICGLSLIAVFAALSVQANTPPEITNVRAEQRKDTKLVDIYYDAADADNDALKVRIEISDNVEVRFKVKNSRSQSVDVYLSCGFNDVMPACSDWIQMSVAPGKNAHELWLSAYYGLLVDDVEVVTLPR